ncbi:kinase-like domain-containing protein [Pholiota molesta]|nr:kinase-like domain-containing protein [Pholiota molesta]
MAFPLLPLPLGVMVGRRRTVVGSTEPTPEETFSNPGPRVTLQREYTVLKLLSRRREPDFVSNTVAFCEWHTPSSLDPNVPPLLKMARFGVDKQVVVLKSRLSGGRRGHGNLNELEILRALPSHPNIIVLRDHFFTFYGSYQINLVLDCMEGNFYHLIRCRKGRHFAGGLVSSMLHQIALGLAHIHHHGYLHFNLCPENILVTTTGIHQYPVVPSSPDDDDLAAGATQRDVVVIIKLAGFDHARRAGSAPADMGAGFHWYRAPEVVLQDPTHAAPVDMWALGAIVGEVLTLEALFPGQDEALQVLKIIEVLGCPAARTTFDLNGEPVDGGSWAAGYSLARLLGLTLPQITARPLVSLFSPPPPASLLLLLRRLLMYDPRNRLTSRECLNHAYFRETKHHRTVPDLLFPLLLSS